MSINSDMNQAIIDLDTAVQQHAMASKRQAESRKELIAAMNRVNDAQKSARTTRVRLLPAAR